MRLNSGHRYFGIGETKGITKTLVVVLIHIACWIVFLLLPAIFNPRRQTFELSGGLEELMEIPRLVNAIFLILVFYFNYYIAIPRFYLREKYLLLLTSFVSTAVLFCVINYNVMPPHGFMHRPPAMFNQWPEHMGPMEPGPGHHNFGPHDRMHNLFGGNSFNLFMFIIVYAFSFALCLYEQWQKTKEEKLNAEISFLKAQINPHFLFNTLNSIYSLALTKSDNAPDAIVKLSGMMRYSVSESNHRQVSLAKEVAYITNYIELQRLRLTDKVKVTFEVWGELDDKQIAPFLLIPFVENAFKYGVNTEEESVITVGITVGKDGLHLSVFNKKVHIRPEKDNSTGLGIKTTKQRLKLLYPGKHILDVNDGADNFFVSLQIQLK